MSSEVERIVLLDGGGFTGSQRGTWEPRSLFLLEMLKSSGYDGVTLGHAELKLGKELLVSLAKDGSVPFLSANLWDVEADALLLPTHRIVEKKGVRVGITAVTVLGDAIRAKFEEEGFSTLDPKQVLGEVLQKLRRESDIVVLIARMSSRDARPLAEHFRGMIDVVIVGNGEAGRGVVHPENGGAVFITAGNRGQSLGVTRVALAGNRIDRITGDEFVLDKERPQSEAVVAMVADFERNLNLSMQKAAAAQVGSRSTDGHYYLSATSCAECHPREYDIWADTPHAHAFQTLVDAGTEALPECYQCHVTGHDDPAGYHPAVEEARDLVNVQCEVCHDKGSLHARDGSYGSALLMNSCVQCHDADNSPDFDPEIYWLMIEH